MMLVCPLCCGEKFSCAESLKYHLLSMTVNIYCPSCNKLCDGIPQLTEHLDKECHQPVSGNGLGLTAIKEEDDTCKNESSCDKPHMDEETTIDQIELDDPTDEILDPNSFQSDTSVVLDGESLVVTGHENGEIQEEVFSCSSCGVNFTSIMEHIQQYHDGQEVVVEMSESTVEQISKPEQLLELQDKLNKANDENTEDSSMESGEEQDAKYPQVLNTLKQEECVDRDGRVYTRKVVQIEKFWIDEKSGEAKPSTNRRQAICERYNLGADGELVAMGKDDEAKDDKKVLQVYTCSRCQMQFQKITHFYKHTCNINRANEYRCAHCDVCFNNSKSLCAHMKAHKVMNPLAHVSSATASAPFLCTKCDTIFPTNKSLRLHQRMHDPIKIKEIEAPVDYGITGPPDVSDVNKPREMFICPVCTKTYDKVYEAVHMETHNDEEDFHCDICNRKFYTHDNLKMHMRVHAGGKPFSCTYCKHAFDTGEALSEHMETHSKDTLVDRYSCGFCGRKFARPHEKVKHERIHTGEKPHECEICGKTFRVSYCLTLHMRTHTGARPYICKHCGKRFKAHSVYNHHLLTHSDERNYKCPYCPKAFKTGVQLAGHKNSHTKPFSCTECNRPFASLYAVRSHMETHKRENNLKFSCYLCGASYARNFALRDHIREVHNNTQIVVANVGEDGNIIMHENVELEGMEDFKATTSILPDVEPMDEIQAETTDEDL